MVQPLAMRDALRQIRSFATNPTGSDSLCRPCAQVLPVTGAAVSTICGPIATDTVCATDDVAFRLDELQLDLGEGPCWEAFATRRPVLVPDLHEDQPHWPIFGAAAQTSGAAAVFAFPLYVGTTGVGTLNLYRDTPGPLGMEALHHACTLAEAVADALLRRIMANTATHPNKATPPSDPWRDSPRDRRQIHQATGIIVAQLHLPAPAAYARLRGHAFATDTTMAVVADDVVTHRLYLPQDPR